MKHPTSRKDRETGNSGVASAISDITHRTGKARASIAREADKRAVTATIAGRAAILRS